MTPTIHQQQKQETLSYWDEFYAKKSAGGTGDNNNATTTDHDKSNPNVKNDNTEWIVQPSAYLFEKLYEKLPQPPPPQQPLTEVANDKTAEDDNGNAQNKNGVRILEIGCGTSTLARSFWLFCRDMKGRHDISICATDVSEICIQHNIERDQQYLGEQGQEGGCLEYCTLNVTEPPTAQEEDNHMLVNNTRMAPNSFDMILDKACLDTFAFRSRQRGDQKDVLVQKVLNNIHSLLKDNSGVYIIISPRIKFKSVRDYEGFQKVERSILDPNYVGDSHGKYYCKKSKPGRKNFYMYACYKKTSGDNNNNNNDPVVATSSSSQPPRLEDSDRCSKCSLSFLEFRKGEDPKGRGMKFWQRLFRGHCRHCKGESTATTIIPT